MNLGGGDDGVSAHKYASAHSRGVGLFGYQVKQSIREERDATSFFRSIIS